jgi:ribonuclease P protein component
MRVRRFGRSFAHPLVILIIHEGNHPQPRFAVTAGTSLGNAVQRNRAKRILRAALNELIHQVQPGCNGILIARKSLLNSNSREAKIALDSMFRQAGIYLESDGKSEQL